jgi:hypothetical protein
MHHSAQRTFTAGASRVNKRLARRLFIRQQAMPADTLATMHPLCMNVRRAMMKLKAAWLRRKSHD